MEVDSIFGGSVWDAADQALTRLCQVLSQRKHKHVKAKCVESLARLASLRADLRSHIRRQESVFQRGTEKESGDKEKASDGNSLEEPETPTGENQISWSTDAAFDETRFETALRDQCEALALDLYSPFEAAMGLMSQRVLLVVLDGLQKLAAAGLFAVVSQETQHSKHSNWERAFFNDLTGGQFQIFLSEISWRKWPLWTRVPFIFN
eukprot:Gregarina_sp_Poly_1__4719@NODE_251_length_10668_cov_46_370814_g33_i1_p5_GENE_NODE_251_length_10668_cov_46_370814_g33_i1NODE_251_length_10668_cov_46_370814_g33_i1_p5_ORF_typecomplete_len207_score35_78DCB/PF16213_5/2e05_NODE_251_length_10668_cov_46_370814_g33_i190209640